MQLTQKEEEESNYALGKLWNANDVIQAANMNGVDITMEQALAWIFKNKERFKSQILDIGNEIIKNMTSVVEDWSVYE